MATEPTKTNPIADLQDWMNLFSGKTQTTTVAPETETTTSTTKSNMSAADIQQQIDMAMAPVNVEQHTNGMYGSTSLAIARGQIAADIAAKNAGSTTTNTRTSSGRTSTTETPGALSSSKGVLGLLGGQIAGPLINKVGKKGTDWLAEQAGKAGDSIMSTIPGTTEWNTANLFDTGNTAATASVDTATSPILDTAKQYAGEAVGSAVAGGADLLSGAWDSVKSGADSLGKALGLWADGGEVDTSDMGYAEGGPVRGLDAPSRSGSNLVLQSLAKPTISANGAIAPPAAKADTVGDSATKALQHILGSVSGGASFDPTKGMSLTTGAPETTSLTSGATGSLVAPDAMKGVGLQNVMAGMLPGAALLHTLFPGVVPEGAQSMVMKNILAAIGAPPDYKMTEALTPSEEQTQADAVTAQLQQTLQVPISYQSEFMQNAYDQQTNDSRYSGGGSGRYTGPAGDAKGDSGAVSAQPSSGSDASNASSTAADGGFMRGPGTGTSDSIPARLSDGETVITAKTTAKVKQLLGDDFFHNLEQQFNAPAAQAQVAKGRA